MVKKLWIIVRIIIIVSLMVIVSLWIKEQQHTKNNVYPGFIKSLKN